MPNRLAASTSPYLQQHRDNPVNWWEWSPEAFAEAEHRGVPVLLSIGYAACHWCHVISYVFPSVRRRRVDAQNMPLQRAHRLNVMLRPGGCCV